MEKRSVENITDWNMQIKWERKYRKEHKSEKVQHVYSWSLRKLEVWAEAMFD